MEEKKNNLKLNPQTKEQHKPTYEELQAQLMQAQQVIAGIKMEAQKKIEAMNYANAFQQQQFMLEIIKMKDTFPPIMVEKAINAINNFWFEEDKEVKDEQEQG